MIRALSLSIIFVICLTGCSPFGSSKITNLEGRLETIDLELKQLAYPSFRGGVGALGYRTPVKDSPNYPFEIEIDLEQVQLVDQIVLVPVFTRSIRKDIRADMFPREFQITAGTADNREGVLVAECSAGEESEMGVAPYIINFPELKVSWVRISIPRLYPMLEREEIFGVQLSEILIFSEEKNVALRKDVSVSLPKSKVTFGISNLDYLVDGVMPYLLDKAQKTGTLASMFHVSIENQPSWIIDLGEKATFSEIRLHTIDLGDNLPQVHHNALGIPQHLRIEAANFPDFSDASLILDFRWESIYEIGPILMWNVPETTCRYVRLVMVKPSMSYVNSGYQRVMGFAEVELLSNGQNVALHKKVDLGPVDPDSRRSPEALTDGLNEHGEIISTREWMNELTRRNTLELERIAVAENLQSLYHEQRVHLTRMRSLAVSLLVLIGFILILAYLLRLRQENRMRERIAANLHDELGANLHAIGILGDVAEKSVNAPERLVETVRRIRAVTERTGLATRICMSILERNAMCEDLVSAIRGDARRLLVDIDYSINIQGEEALDGLKPRRRMDLYLFIKESLTNIIRHANASAVSIDLLADKRELRLFISDDGCGFGGSPPKSLLRRARLMGGKVVVENLSAGGMRISLKLKISRRIFL